MIDPTQLQYLGAAKSAYSQDGSEPPGMVLLATSESVQSPKLPGQALKFFGE